MLDETGNVDDILDVRSVPYRSYWISFQGIGYPANLRGQTSPRGVGISYDGCNRRIRAAREVILSLGTIHTPKVPMQSVTTQVDRYRLRADGVALAAGRGAGLGLGGRALRGQHDAQGGQHVALLRVGRTRNARGGCCPWSCRKAPSARATWWPGGRDSQAAGRSPITFANTSSTLERVGTTTSPSSPVAITSGIAVRRTRTRPCATQREPVGVAALIGPRNGTFNIFVYKTLSSLAAGCTAVRKSPPEPPVRAFHKIKSGGGAPACPSLR